MKSRLVGMFAALACGFLAAAHAAGPRIGTYDSRAIAIAYAGSPAQQKVMEPLRAAMKKATQENNQPEVARLNALGRAMQDTAHRQAFSTAPVDDLLLHIADSLPRIRRDAGVEALVSKWDAAGLAVHAGAERVDVTDAMVDAFMPTERQRKVVEEIRRKPPLPLDEVRAGRP